MRKYVSISLDSATVKSKVENYLKDNQYALDINISDDSSDSSGGLKELDLNTISRIFQHHSVTDDGPIFISIAFSKNVLPSSTVQDLRDSLKYVSLDKLPMPGFQYPLGWDIYPLTPVSSFKDGVTIASYQNGRLHFKVDTRFFAIYGITKGLILPEDASTPKYAYFQVRKDIHGLIDVDMTPLFAQTILK